MLNFSMDNVQYYFLTIHVTEGDFGNLRKSGNIWVANSQPHTLTLRVCGKKPKLMLSP